MIAGANYREGVAITSDGAVYVFGNSTGVPVTGQAQTKGADVNGGMAVDADGRLIVRFT